MFVNAVRFLHVTLQCLVFGLLTTTHVYEICAEEEWPLKTQGFWEVKKRSMHPENEVDKTFADQELVIISGRNIVIASYSPWGLSTAVLHKSAFDSVDPKSKDCLTGHIVLPQTTLGIDGKLRESEEKVPVIIRNDSLEEDQRIKLTVRFGDQEFVYDAIKVESEVGRQKLSDLLTGDVLCPPPVRKLLENMSKDTVNGIK